MNDQPKTLSVTRPPPFNQIVIRRGRHVVILRTPRWLNPPDKRRVMLKQLVESGVLQR